MQMTLTCCYYQCVFFDQNTKLLLILLNFIDEIPETCKVTGKNLVYQTVVFNVQNALKLAYVRL
jgi:hypothetical protein